jgi:hypothetical protein
MRGRAVARGLLTTAGLLLTLVWLSACGTTTEDSSAPTTSVSAASVSSSKPFDAYVVMGGRIKSCWFNADAPLLPKYVYRADVSPDGATVKITIHERAELGRAGLSTYAIDFKQSGPSTVITTENRTMPPDLAAKMQYDIDRWQRGESDCNKKGPPLAAAAAAPPPKAAAHGTKRP